MIEFDETWMTPSPDRSGVKKKASPGTSRVEKTRAKSGRNVKPKPGLSRACVAVTRINSSTYEVVVKGTRQLVGWIKRADGGSVYSYKIHGEIRAHGGFSTQKAALLRMLSKV